jgi:hypothetical protein
MSESDSPIARSEARTQGPPGSWWRAPQPPHRLGNRLWFTLAGHPDHNLRVVIQDTTLARWSGDDVRGSLHGLREGASIISFVVRRGTTTIYEAPPLNFRVRVRE